MIRPRLSQLFDADDARMLARMVVLSVLVIWLLLLVGVALGLGVRLFFMAKGG